MTLSAAAGEAAGRFLETPRGRIYCLHSPGRGDTCVVMVPPFAEEMNRSRRMCRLLAAQLAAAGVGVLIVDLYGTGESDGDFADARWQSWCEDLDVVCQFAREAGSRRIALLGVRLGALLALDHQRRSAPRPAADGGIVQLILWQPVLDGRQHMNQFLRLKLAAGLRKSAAVKESTASLRERLSRGEKLEVAGYELAPDLLAAVDSLDGQSLVPASVERVDWLEVSMNEAPELMPASQSVLAAWRAAGVNVYGRAVRGEAFWALQEITIAPELIAVTRDLALEALIG